MGLRIRTNIAALNAQRRLADSTTALAESLAKLSSGHRINKSADDAAGLAIGSNLRADIRSLNQARRNALDGVSVVQTAEGGLNETTAMLIRLRELAIQAATDTVGPTERAFMQKEYAQLKDEIDRIAVTTEFNGIRLLAGNGEKLPAGVQADGIEMPLEIQVGKDHFPDHDNGDSPMPINIVRIDLSQMSSFADDLGIGSSNDEDGTRLLTRDEAQMSIVRVDTAIAKVSEYRSYLGATQNRLQAGINNLGIQIENMQAASTRIMDTDFAEETAHMTQMKILQQAGTSVLSTANVQPQVALSLITNV